MQLDSTWSNLSYSLAIPDEFSVSVAGCFQVTLPLDREDTRWTALMLGFASVLYALFKLFSALRSSTCSLRCSQARNGAQQRWLCLLEAGLVEVIDREHDAAVAEKWAYWAALGNRIRANKEAKTWKECNQISQRLKKHAWHLRRVKSKID